MPRPLSILAPTRYPWRFNAPRNSCHQITRRNFIAFNKLSAALEGVTLFNPLPLRRFDLVHAFNRIPLGPTPYVIGFESHLPRAFGHEQSWLYRNSIDHLTSDRCRRIIAISHYAKRHFMRQHNSSPHAEALLAKLDVRYPTIATDADDGFAPSQDKKIRLLFVGNHFARKGGCVALRIAEIANARHLPIIVEIVSSLEMGAMSWTDPTRPAFYDPDRALLASLPNIVNHGKLPNAQTLALMKQAHFLLLPTFSDTFGYSAIEAMGAHTPVIATAQGALPEFITDGKNGILLVLDTDEIGEWRHIGRSDKHMPAYEKLFREEIDRLAAEALEKLEPLTAAPAYVALRAEAGLTARTMFDPVAGSTYWSQVYDEAVI